jgi:hypothetical protein
MSGDLLDADTAVTSPVRKFHRLPVVDSDPYAPNAPWIGSAQIETARCTRSLETSTVVACRKWIRQRAA